MSNLLVTVGCLVFKQALSWGIVTMELEGNLSFQT
jgi:hypothetical protein